MKRYVRAFTGMVVFLVLLNSNTANAQYEMDQVLRIGYRMGSETFDPAYSLSTFDQSTSTYTLDKTFKDHMGLGNVELWYCRYSPHVFYEAGLDGMFNALINYVANDLHEYERQFSKFKNCTKNGASQVHGIDYDILNFKMAFGTKGIYLGGQYKWTRLGSFTDDNTSGNMQVTGGIGHSETNMRSVGLGLHANIAIKEFVTQTHLMFNWCKGEEVNKGEGPFFQGKEIEFESIISFGKAFGGYVTPFFKKRFGETTPTFTENYSRGFNSSFCFGIKLGIYIAQESDDGDVYISVE